MGIFFTRPNIFSHSEIIYLYKNISKYNADIIYEAMDKDFYPDLDDCRYIDLVKLKKSIDDYQNNNPDAILLNIQLLTTKRGKIPINTYVFYWNHYNNTIVIKS